MPRSRTYIATPPGATIKEQLIDRGLLQKEFAIRMDMSEKHISKLINGEVHLTPDVAVRLEMVLGIPAKYWNNLEATYREKLIKVDAENSMDTDEEIARMIPYNKMSKLGWIFETRKPYERVVHLRKYFEVVSLELIKDMQLSRIACRRLKETDESNLALMAWAQKARIEARSIETAPINVQGLVDAIPEIRQMTTMSPNEFCPKLIDLLSQCGIALIFLPHISGSFLHGATFVDGKKIVVGLTVQGEYADRFWFSLFHELGHVISGHTNQIDGTTEADEKEADIFARDTLIPMEEYLSFVGEGALSKTSINSFSDSINIHSGIVVGRLQNDGIIKHNSLNDLKEKYTIA